MDGAGSPPPCEPGPPCTPQQQRSLCSPGTSLADPRSGTFRTVLIQCRCAYGAPHHARVSLRAADSAVCGLFSFSFSFFLFFFVRPLPGVFSIQVSVRARGSWGGGWPHASLACARATGCCWLSGWLFWSSAEMPPFCKQTSAVSTCANPRPRFRTWTRCSPRRRSAA